MNDKQVEPAFGDEVARGLAFADGALGAAGHEITDPWTRELLERAARHEVTTEEAIAAVRARFQA